MQNGRPNEEFGVCRPLFGTLHSPLCTLDLRPRVANTASASAVFAIRPALLVDLQVPAVEADFNRLADRKPTPVSQPDCSGIRETGRGLPPHFSGFPEVAETAQVEAIFPQSDRKSGRIFFAPPPAANAVRVAHKSASGYGVAATPTPTQVSRGAGRISLDAPRGRTRNSRKMLRIVAFWPGTAPGAAGRFPRLTLGSEAVPYAPQDRRSFPPGPVTMIRPHPAHSGLSTRFGAPHVTILDRTRDPRPRR